MKKLMTVFMALVLLIPAAAWAGNFFSTADEQKIRQTAARVFPGIDVDFNYTVVGGAGILIGPLPDGKNIFIPVNDRDDIFIYQPPPEYERKAWEIIKTAYRIIDSRPASMTLRRK